MPATLQTGGDPAGLEPAAMLPLGRMFSREKSDPCGPPAPTEAGGLNTGLLN